MLLDCEVDIEDDELVNTELICHQRLVVGCMPVDVNVGVADLINYTGLGVILNVLKTGSCVGNYVNSTLSTGIGILICVHRGAYLVIGVVILDNGENGACTDSNSYSLLSGIARHVRRNLRGSCLSTASPCRRYH